MNRTYQPIAPRLPKPPARARRRRTTAAQLAAGVGPAAAAPAQDVGEIGMRAAFAPASERGHAASSAPSVLLARAASVASVSTARPGSMAATVASLDAGAAARSGRPAWCGHRPDRAAGRGCDRRRARGRVVVKDVAAVRDSLALSMLADRLDEVGEAAAVEAHGLQRPGELRLRRRAPRPAPAPARCRTTSPACRRPISPAPGVGHPASALAAASPIPIATALCGRVALVRQAYQARADRSAQGKSALTDASPLGARQKGFQVAFGVKRM